MKKKNYKSFFGNHSPRVANDWGDTNDLIRPYSPIRANRRIVNLRMKTKQVVNYKNYTALASLPWGHLGVPLIIKKNA